MTTLMYVPHPVETAAPLAFGKGALGLIEGGTFTLRSPDAREAPRHLALPGARAVGALADGALLAVGHLAAWHVAPGGDPVRYEGPLGAAGFDRLLPDLGDPARFWMGSPEWLEQYELRSDHRSAMIVDDLALPRIATSTLTAVGPGTFLAADRDALRKLSVDGESHVVVPLPARPFHVAAGPEGRVWVSFERGLALAAPGEGHIVSRLDTAELITCLGGAGGLAAALLLDDGPDAARWSLLVVDGDLREVLRAPLPWQPPANACARLFVAVSPDASRVAVGGAGCLALYDVSSREMLTALGRCD